MATSNSNARTHLDEISSERVEEFGLGENQIILDVEPSVKYEEWINVRQESMDRGDITPPHEIITKGIRRGLKHDQDQLSISHPFSPLCTIDVDSLSEDELWGARYLFHLPPTLADSLFEELDWNNGFPIRAVGADDIYRFPFEVDDEPINRGYIVIVADLKPNSRDLAIVKEHGIASTRSLEQLKRPQKILKLESGEQSLEIGLPGAHIWSYSEGNFYNEVLGDGMVRMKSNASHFMAPVGLGEAVNRHGPSRFLDWRIHNHTKEAVDLSTLDKNQGLKLQRSVRFQETDDGKGVGILDVVTPIEERWNGSLGNHFYFSVPEDKLEQVLIDSMLEGALDQNGNPLKRGHDQLYQIIERGGAVYLPSKDGKLPVHFPRAKNPDCTMAVSSVHSPSFLKKADIGFILWHRPGTDSISIEPVIGLGIDEKGTFRNDNLLLEPGESMYLITTVVYS